MRNQQSRRPAVLRRERLARPVQGNQVLRSIEIRQRQIGRESLLGHDQAVLRFLLNAGALQQSLDRHTLERIVEAAPCRHAVDVALDRLTRQREEFVPRERERSVDQPRDHECPLRGVYARHVAIMQDRPFCGLNLAGRDSWIPHAQAWARADAALKRSASLGPFFRMGSTPKTLSNPFTTALTLRFHKSWLPIPRSRSTDVISTP